MANSPSQEAQDLVTFIVKSNGNEINEDYQVFEIQVEKEINRIPSATIRLHDGDVATRTFDIADSSDFIPGATIEILAGYDGDNSTIFKGVVVSQRIVLDGSEGSVLEVNCKDEAIKMTVGRKNAYFTDSKDSDAISTLIQNHGLSADVDSTTFQHPELVQYYSTDWDFMLLRAEANGLLAMVDQGKVNVKAPDPSSSAVLTASYGSDLIEFNADLNATDQADSAKGYSWDASQQQLIQSPGDSPASSSQGNITSSTLSDVLSPGDLIVQSTGAIDESVLKTWASALLTKTSLARITGEAAFEGSSKALPGVVIEFEGVGDRYSGPTLITRVQHEIREGKWTTRTGFGMDGQWFAEQHRVQAPLGSGLLPGVQGLMNAVVKQIDQDPESEYRVLVTLPLMNDDSNGVWARLSNHYATNGQGNFTYPEIGDEVIVGFLNADPRYPVILGSVYSSARKPPYEPTSDNYTKAFVSQSECKIEFDDENKVITLITPGENQMVISDKDKGIDIKDQNGNEILTNDKGITITDCNGNKITMSSSGIALNTNADIKLTATGNIELTPTADAKITATGNVSLSGVQISNSANAAFSASGQASVSVSSSGTTTVKGSMVMIN